MICYVETPIKAFNAWVKGAPAVLRNFEPFSVMLRTLEQNDWRHAM
jgi:hypothetical protein